MVVRFDMPDTRWFEWHDEASDGPLAKWLNDLLTNGWTPDADHTEPLIPTGFRYLCVEVGPHLFPDRAGWVDPSR